MPGQIVNKSKSNGLNVCQMWVRLFEQNEINFKAKRLNWIMTDKELTAAMLDAFPSREKSEIFYQPNRVRSRYNRGVLTGKKRPKVKSCKYVREGKKIIQVKPRKRKRRTQSEKEKN